MIFRNFLWFCAGGHRSILEKFKALHNIYAGIGAFVFFTSLFAFISSFYALQYIFSELYLIIPISILWGLFIFNLDRYLVSSMDLSKIRKIYLAIPRIIIALFLAILISKPLELKFFEYEIDKYLLEQRIDELNEQKQKFINSPNGLADAQIKLSQIEEQIKKGNEKSESLKNEYVIESDGSGGTGKLGIGPIFKEKKRVSDEYESIWNEKRNILESERNDLREKIALKETELENETAESKKIINTEMGLLERIQALSDLEAQYSTIRNTGLLLIFLFIFIETSPILFKLMQENTPYKEELLFMLENDILHFQRKREKLLSSTQSDGPELVNY